ncbi:hypothetical protein GCM10009678_56350 [Actinomadura kijaniata]|uniref:Uncharacterized protein n=1 Tax=Actinomadura namibiensis TaxID=182080 RepID=A0A7W3QMZ1_ACTNM|nr:DUF6463 family protein [Actinomadura namibiensis]MBA8953006.1 hypothetical protein [Actinomadura namibiensis]
MIKWSGWIITLCGIAHTVGALTVEKAARHAGTWFSGGLWEEELSEMSPAGSAYFLSLDSFGVPLTLVGLIVLWLERRGITPPMFIAWILAVWTLVDAVVLPFTPWPLFVIAIVLLVLGTRRARTAS